MKKTIIAITAILANTLLLFVSCEKQDFPVREENKSFTATIDQSLTKTILNSDFKVFWEPTDTVNINGTVYSALITSDSTKAEFRYVTGPEPMAPYKAIYPASLYVDGRYVFPTHQTWVQGEFDLPMYAESNTEHLAFKNICGVLHFALKGTEKVKNIIVTANEPICGIFTMEDATTVKISHPIKTVTLDCGGVQLNSGTATDFYIYLPPNTYTAGMRVIMTNTENEIFEKYTDGDVSIPRNKIATFNWSVSDFTAVDLQTQLGAVIEGAVAGKGYGESVVLTLDGSEEYTLEKAVDVGLVNLVIIGNGAKVTLTDGAQISGMQGLEFNSVNFDCSANTTTSPIALSGTTDERLKGPNIQEELSNNAFYNMESITISGCNFSGVKRAIVTSNKKDWALRAFVIWESIIQFDLTTNYSYIDWDGGKYACIKDIVIDGSTLYNIQPGQQNRFIQCANASNIQPQKIWKTPQFDAKASVILTNNTFVNIASGKEFANNYPNKNNVILTWTGNIFYDVYRLQKIGTANTRTFTAADNSICGITKTPVDATDIRDFATEDTALCEGYGKFTVPTTALDLSKPDLKENFHPSADSYSGQHGFGDPRWL